jgi:hypothetical protein
MPPSAVIGRNTDALGDSAGAVVPRPRQGGGVDAPIAAAIRSALMSPSGVLPDGDDAGGGGGLRPYVSERAPSALGWPEASQLFMIVKGQQETAA